MARRRASTWWRHALLLLAGVALLAFFIERSDPAAVWDRVRVIPASTYVAASLVYALAWVFRIVRYEHLARHLDGGPGFLRAAGACLGANTLNLLLPARLGDLTLVAAISHRRPAAHATALVLQWRLVDLLALALLAGIALAGLFIDPAPGPGLVALVVLASVVLAVAGGVLIAWVLGRSQPLLEWITNFLGKRLFDGRAHGHARAFTEANLHLTRASVLVPGLLLAVGAWLAHAVVAGLFLDVIAPEAPLGLALGATVLANMAMMLPTTPGGLGIFEGAFAAVLIGGGIARAPAVATAVVTHIFMNVFTMVIGGPGAYRLAHEGTEAVAKVLGKKRGSDGEASRESRDGPVEQAP